MTKKKAFDPDLVRELAGLMDETNLSEIEVETGDVRIRVARAIAEATVLAPRAAAAPAAPQPVEAPAAPQPAAPAQSSGTKIRSPMVGTAYRAAEPGAKPFIEVGDSIREGQTIAIIEAMKTMNAIPATSAGVVKEIHFEDGQPVEFDEPLITIE